MFRYKVNIHLINIIHTGGIAVPVMVYDNSCGSDNFIELPGQSLMWKGERSPCP